MASRSGILSDQLVSCKESGRTLLAVLIDPDKPGKDLSSFARMAEEQGTDVFLVGGSLLMKDDVEDTITAIRNGSSLPIYLFPSGLGQISPKADGILFLSLISGRNADLLIGRQVEAAPLLSITDLHVMSTGYMLVDCGNVTTAHYMSQSRPIPGHKPDIACATAKAGELMGMSCIYMDGGSGAKSPISAKIIESVSSNLETPLIIGGGIRNAETAANASRAGAQMIVVGNALEENPELLQDISIAVHSSRVSP
jgi:phosphoglycerol geranylgeranyltransferase